MSDLRNKAASLLSEADSLRAKASTLYAKYNSTGDERIREEAYNTITEMQAKLDKAKELIKEAEFLEAYGE